LLHYTVLSAIKGLALLLQKGEFGSDC
jgi:hypothetical protein